MIIGRPNGSVRPLAERDRENSDDERFEEFEIYYRVCSKFIPKSETSETCQCNRPRKLHGQVTSKPKTGKPKPDDLQNEQWDQNFQTREEQEAAHGKLINDALYVRVHTAIKLEKISNFIWKFWKLPQPKLILSIIGGGSEFTLQDPLEANLINAIANVAIRSNIWMITNGYNNGLVQLVGQAIQKAKLKESEHAMAALAICNWGGVKKMQALIKEERKESIQQTRTDISESSDDDIDDEAEIRKKKKKKKKKQHGLDMNHTHYLLLDDGKYRTVDTGDYRTKLCSEIIERYRQKYIHTTAVTIVVGGGDTTISNIYHDLKANIPVVIIEGTGRVADFFSRCLMYTKDIITKSNDEEIYGIEELQNEIDVENLSRSKSPDKPSATTDNKRRSYRALRLERKALPHLFSRYEQQLRQDLMKTLGFTDSNVTKPSNTTTEKNPSTEKIDHICEQVMFCLQPSVRSNITVFNLKSENDLSSTILRGISKLYKKTWEKNENESKIHTSNDVQDDSREKVRSGREKLLELAMDLDCIDVAKEFALENSFSNINDVTTFFKDALKRNLFTFVYEFIKLGADLEKIFFPDRIFTRLRDDPVNIVSSDRKSTATNGRYNLFIKELYVEAVVDDGNNHLTAFIEDDAAFTSRYIDSTAALNVILRTLIGDYMYKLYFDSPDEENRDRIENGLTAKTTEKRLHKPRELESMDYLPTEEKDQARDYIMRDLFLWCILTNRIDMAKVFLSYMKYRICPALIATKILKQYHHKAAYGELKDSYNENADYFEKYAVDCLDKCDDYDAAKACEIVLQRNELYGYVTCLQVAADAQDKSFIAAPCCVEAMDNIWYDKLHPNQSRKRDRLRLFVGIMSLGLLAPSIVKYREREKAKIGETLTASLKPYGINYCDPYALEFPRIFKSPLGLNSFLFKLIDFHQSLLMKFFSHFITYCFFLLLFSYVLLFTFRRPTDQTPSIHWTEILTIILVSCMLVGEVHYFFTQDSLKLTGKFRSYFRDPLKAMKLIAFVLFYIGLIVRFTYASSDDNFIAARVIMAIDIELWWLASLSFIIVIKALGPQLVAITYMMKDLMFFVCIIAVVMIAYGVASRSMAYYPQADGFTIANGGNIDPSFDGRSVFRQVIAPVYFFLHGQIGSELDHLDRNSNAGWSIATQVLLALHMLFVNILLTNLLIAMFSKRFDKVYEDTRNIWHSQQYSFTRDYYTRAPLIPPFSLAYDVYCLSRMFYFFLRHKLLKKSANHQAKVFKMIPEDRKRIKEWYDFEGAATYEHAHGEVRAAKTALTKSSTGDDASSVENTEDMLGGQEDSGVVVENLKQVQENVKRLNRSIGTMKDEFDKSLNQKVPLLD